MTYTIPQERLNNIIIQYLNSNWYPDYGWDSHEDYRIVWEKWNELEFTVNDEITFSLFLEKIIGYNAKHHKILMVFPNFYEKMNDLFGKNWVEVFSKWFKDNTGLNFDEIIYY
jgi:hypothetical protein